MRAIWVSTGNVGWPAAIARTTSAVLGPTPGRAISSCRARSVGSSRIRSSPLRSSRSAWATAAIRGAFCLARPACQIAFATSASGVSAIRCGLILPTRDRRSLKPRRSLATVVLCDRTVEIRTSNDVIPRLQSSTGYRDSRIRIVRMKARRFTLSKGATGEKAVSPAHKGADHRDHVARAFAKPAGEVREPVRTVGDGFGDSMSRSPELDLERVADSLEARELECGGMHLRQGEGAFDHPTVVAPHRKVSAFREERLEVRDVRAVDLRPRPISDVRRLLVRAFHETDARVGFEETVQVIGRPLQVRLEADSDPVVLGEKLLTDPDGVVGRVRAFHVEPEDAPQPSGRL